MSLLVFCTLWLFSFLGIYTPVIKLIGSGTDEMHYPLDSEAYSNVSLSVCVRIFLSLIGFYAFALILVAVTTHRIDVWRLLESEEVRDQKPSVRTLSEPVGLRLVQRSLTPKLQNEKTWNHFKLYMKTYFESDETITEEAGDVDFNDLDLITYLRNSILNDVARGLRFGAPMWLAYALTFAIFAFLHRILHMGYVRIVMLLLVLTLFVSLLMAISMYVIDKRITSKIESGDLPDPKVEHADMINVICHWCPIISSLYHKLFLMCYFVARLLTQPWLWELHFRASVAISICLGIEALIFLTLIPSLLPSYVAAMALPPYWSNRHRKELLASRSQVFTSGISI